MNSSTLLRFSIILFAMWASSSVGWTQVLDKQAKLAEQTFWDNRDFDWFARSIPFFECPDADITTTYYYRWELLTKHLTYGSPNSGYSFTEFIDRPFWSGAYGAISCRLDIRSMRLVGYEHHASLMTTATIGCELRERNRETTRLG